MSELVLTVIDVGWGDCLLLEFDDPPNDRRFALIDCNDESTNRQAFAWVKRRLQLLKVDFKARKPLFDFVLLTHGHDDHARGLKFMIQQFGAQRLWYPKTKHGGKDNLVKFANKSSNVVNHQSIDNTKVLPSFGGAAMEVLWPPHTAGTDAYDKSNENNNSVVLQLTLGGVSFLTTGDCEAENWDEDISGGSSGSGSASSVTTLNDTIPTNLKVMQIPHHGAKNGVFDGVNKPWFDHLKTAGPTSTKLAISCHISPHKHPHGDVVGALDTEGFDYFRSDEEYHLTFSTDGANVKVKYSHE